jgi:hypothetical protein
MVDAAGLGGSEQGGFASPNENALSPANLFGQEIQTWLTVLRTMDRRFEFTDPPFRQSLPITLAFAATAGRPTAVLTFPHHVIGACRPAQLRWATQTYDMIPVRLDQSPLAATASLVWSGDLPRPLQQVLFDAADGIIL